MIRAFTLIVLLVSTNIFGQTLPGRLKMLIEEKTKEGNGRRPVINEPINVVLNDTTAFSLATDSEGNIIIHDRPKGRYNVKIVRVGCQAQEIRGVIIGEGKTAYVTFQLTCASYINSLTKKEKKKLGYK